jgi:hypothetical protein
MKKLIYLLGWLLPLALTAADFSARFEAIKRTATPAELYTFLYAQRAMSIIISAARFARNGGMPPRRTQPAMGGIPFTPACISPPTLNPAFPSCFIKRSAARLTND